MYDDRFISDREEFAEIYYDRNADILCEKFKYDPRVCEYSVKRGQHTQEQFEKNQRREAELNKYLKEIAGNVFKRAIIVNIDFPKEVSE